MPKKTVKRKTSKKIGPTPIESVRHKDKRKNIRTEKLRDFVRDLVRDEEHVVPPVL